MNKRPLKRSRVKSVSKKRPTLESRRNRRNITSKVVRPSIKRKAKKNSLAEQTKKLVSQSKLIQSLAESNARTQLIEAFTPQIKRMVRRAINEDDELEDTDIPIDEDDEIEPDYDEDITEDDELDYDEGDEDITEDDEPDSIDNPEDVDTDDIDTGDDDEDSGDVTEEDDDPTIDVSDEDEDEPTRSDDEATEAELEELMRRVNEDDEMSDDTEEDGPEITEEDDEPSEPAPDEEDTDDTEDVETGDSELDEYIRKINRLFINEDEEDGDGDDVEPTTDDASTDSDDSGDATSDDSDEPTKDDLEGEIEEAYKRIYKLGRVIKEQNKALRLIKKQMNETTLFNAKLTYVNKILAKNKSLSNVDKLQIVESFDNAKTVREVALVYNSIQKSLISERRRRRLKESRVNRRTNKSSRTNSRKLSLKEAIRRKLRENKGKKYEDARTSNRNGKRRISEGIRRSNRSTTDSRLRNRKINSFRRASMMENNNYNPTSELQNEALIAKFKKLANLNG